MKVDDQGKIIIAVAGMVCITALEGVALYLGIDGQILSGVVGVLGAIVGYAFGVKAAPTQ